MREMPLYSNIYGRKVVYWLSQIGFGAGPLILTWINEICSADTEKRALLVALGNDLAYVVQAVVSHSPLTIAVIFNSEQKTDAV
jgi:ACS family pantothenate transporter-like MFS transporter